MAAPQIISLGIGSPASIGWFLTFGLGDFGDEEPAAATGNAGNIGRGVRDFTFTPRVGLSEPRDFTFSPRESLREVRDFKETP